MYRRADIRNTRGQTMVEFILVVPILLIVLFGIIQFGLTFRSYVALTDSVRAGARTAAVSRLMAPTDRDNAIKAKVKSSTDLDWTKPGAGVTVTSTWAQGSDVAVSATYPYSISLFGVVVKSGNLTSTTTERVE